MMVETKVIGQDSWWDTELQEFNDAIKSREIDRLMKLEKPTREEFDDFCERHKELFAPLIHLVEREPPFALTMYGGVCQPCWLDGFGRYGKWGGFVGKQVKPEDERIKLAHEKSEKEKLEKYGKKPKYWLNPGFTKNPEHQKWRQRQIEIDKGERLAMNDTRTALRINGKLKFVDQVIEIVLKHEGKTS